MSFLLFSDLICCKTANKQEKITYRCHPERSEAESKDLLLTILIPFKFLFFRYAYSAVYASIALAAYSAVPAPQAALMLSVMLPPAPYIWPRPRKICGVQV